MRHPTLTAVAAATAAEVAYWGWVVVRAARTHRHDGHAPSWLNPRTAAHRN